MLGASQGGPGGYCSFSLGFAGINYYAKNKGAGLGAESRGWVQRGERIWFVLHPPGQASPLLVAEQGRNRLIWLSLQRAGLLCTLLEAQGGGTVGTAGGSPGTDEASATSRLQRQAYISPFVTPGETTNPTIPAWPPSCPVLSHHAGLTGPCIATGAGHCGQGLKPSSNTKAWLRGEK